MSITNVKIGYLVFASIKCYDQSHPTYKDIAVFSEEVTNKDGKLVEIGRVFKDKKGAYFNVTGEFQYKTQTMEFIAKFMRFYEENDLRIDKNGFHERRRK